MDLALILDLFLGFLLGISWHFARESYPQPRTATEWEIDEINREALRLLGGKYTMVMDGYDWENPAEDRPSTTIRVRQPVGYDWLGK